MSRSSCSWREGAKQYQETYGTLHLREGTLKRVRSIFRDFTKFMLERMGKEVSLGILSPVDVEAYQLWCINRGITPASTNSHVRHLKAFFSWATSRKLMKENPAYVVKMLREPNTSEAKVLAMDRLRKIHEHLKFDQNPLFVDLFVVILHMALRLGEALRLRRKDVEVKRKLIHIRCREDWQTKDGDDRTLPTNELVLGVLRRRLFAAEPGPDTLLFRSTRGTPLLVENVSHGFKDRVREAGVPEANWYALRHTMLTVLAEQVPDRVLAAWGGHSDPKTTAKFYVAHRKLTLPPPPALL